MQRFAAAAHGTNQTSDEGGGIFWRPKLNSDSSLGVAEDRDRLLGYAGVRSTVHIKSMVTKNEKFMLTTWR